MAEQHPLIEDHIKAIGDRRQALAAEIVKGEQWIAQAKIEDSRLRIAQEVLTELTAPEAQEAATAAPTFLGSKYAGPGRRRHPGPRLAHG